MVGVFAAVLALIVLVVVIVLVTRDDSDTTVPPLTDAQRQSGVVRVTYPDRSLPDEPAVATVGDHRVALYLDDVEGSSRGAQAVLRVGVGDAKPISVTLVKGESATVDGVDITAVAVYDTGDVARETADVKLSQH
jgi:hypothetical protein